MSLLERVEDRLVDPVRAHELANVGHDVALLCGKLGGIALGPEEVDDLFAQAIAARGADLGRPHVRRLTLAHGAEDGDRPELGVHDALVAKEGDEGQDALRQLRAVEEHAEGPPHVPKDLEDVVDDGVMLRRHFGLAGDRSDARHDGLLSRKREKDRSSTAPECWLALLAPRRVPLGLVLRQLEGREPIEIDQRGVGEVGNVEAAEQRLFAQARGQRWQ